MGGEALFSSDCVFMMGLPSKSVDAVIFLEISGMELICRSGGAALSRVRRLIIFFDGDDCLLDASGEFDRVLVADTKGDWLSDM
jgi:hypothetical protein